MGPMGGQGSHPPDALVHIPISPSARHAHPVPTLVFCLHTSPGSHHMNARNIPLSYTHVHSRHADERPPSPGALLSTALG